MSLRNSDPKRRKADVQEFAIIGLGRFGTSLGRTLVKRGHTVLGIDSDINLVQRHSHELNQTVALDSTDEAALREVGIQDYGTVIVAIGSHFEASLMTAVALKGLGVGNVICKATTEVHRDILLRVGADRVVLPEHEAGRRLAEELATPDLLERMNLNGQYALAEIRTPRELVGQSLVDSGLEARHDVRVVIQVREGRVMSPPSRTLPLAADDLLVLVGSPEAIESVVSHG